MGYDLHLRAGRTSTLPPEERDFRASIGGMTFLRVCMNHFGMLASHYSDDDIPLQAAHAVFAEGVARGVEEATSELDFMFSDAGFAAALWRPLDPEAPQELLLPQRGIAMHKLCSNDHWEISHFECIEAIDAWEAAVREAFPNCTEPSLEQQRSLIHALVSDPDYLERYGGGATARSADAAATIDYWFEWIAFLELAAGERGFYHCC